MHLENVPRLLHVPLFDIKLVHDFQLLNAYVHRMNAVALTLFEDASYHPQPVSYE